MIDRRRFLIGGGLSMALAGGATEPRSRPRPDERVGFPVERRKRHDDGSRPGVTIFLGGDVMTGRGVDQIFPRSVDPRLYEPYVRDAGRYVELAERANGPIPRPVEHDYVWGDLLELLDRVAPDVRIVNLETAVTTSADPWEGKGIHYRMHPDNAACLTAAGIDCCVLANNHVLDWGAAGLQETLDVLERAALRVAGAGRTLEAAREPAALELGGGSGAPAAGSVRDDAAGEPDVPPGGGRVLVFAFGTTTSGIPRDWRAGEGPTGRAGVDLLEELSESELARVGAAVREAKRQGDVAVASIHWGGNWGYGVPERQRDFAHGLIDEAGIDVVHGHSSHHAKGIEVYRRRPILYGCGDLLNDYEGIEGYERYRDDLPLAYIVALDPGDGDPLDPHSGGLGSFEMIPLRIRRLRLQRASEEETRWLREMLDRQGEALGTAVETGEDGRLELRWD